MILRKIILILFAIVAGCTSDAPNPNPEPKPKTATLVISFSQPDDSKQFRVWLRKLPVSESEQWFQVWDETMSLQDTSRVLLDSSDYKMTMKAFRAGLESVEPTPARTFNGSGVEQLRMENYDESQGRQ